MTSVHVPVPERRFVLSTSRGLASLSMQVLRSSEVEHLRRESDQHPSQRWRQYAPMSRWRCPHDLPADQIEMKNTLFSWFWSQFYSSSYVNSLRRDFLALYSSQKDCYNNGNTDSQVACGLQTSITSIMTKASWNQKRKNFFFASGSPAFSLDSFQEVSLIVVLRNSEASSNLRYHEKER